MTKNNSNIFPLLTLLVFLVYLPHAMLIQHAQASYRLGTNYAGIPNQSINKCQQKQTVFVPEPVNPITITCTLPRVFNPSTRSCECLSQTIFDPSTNQCLCPSDRPLWNGKRCVKCPDTTYFDSEEKQCYQCPQGFIHSIGYNGKPRCQPSY